MQHRVRLTNGEVVLLREDNNELHIGQLDESDVDWWIASISGNGVLVAPNSSYAPEQLTQGLKEGPEYDPNTARFGVSETEGEDDEEGDLWYTIGLIEVDGEGENAIDTVPGEIATVMVRNHEDIDQRFPGLKDKKLKAAQVIAEALTEYAERRGLSADWFYQNIAT